jgi:hypothetical protein
VLDHVLPQLSKYTIFLVNRVFQFLVESSAGWVIPGLESIKFQSGQLSEIAKHVFSVGIEAVVFWAVGHIESNLLPVEMRSFGPMGHIWPRGLRHIESR